MSYSTTLGSAASIAQQLHTIARWRDIKIEQHQHALENLGNAELVVAGQSYGLDLVLFYLRMPSLNTCIAVRLTQRIAEFYSYNVTALAVFFWFVERSAYTSDASLTLVGHRHLHSRSSRPHLLRR